MIRKGTRMACFFLPVAMTPPPTSHAPAVTLQSKDFGGAFFAVSVTNAPASAAWYRDTLGLEILRQAGAPDGAVRFAPQRRAHDLLETVPRAHATAPPAMPDRSHVLGTFKTGYWVSRLEDPTGWTNREPCWCG